MAGKSPKKKPPAGSADLAPEVAKLPEAQQRELRGLADSLGLDLGSIDWKAWLRRLIALVSLLSGGDGAAAHGPVRAAAGRPAAGRRHREAFIALLQQGLAITQTAANALEEDEPGWLGEEDAPKPPKSGREGGAVDDPAEEDEDEE